MEIGHLHDLEFAIVSDSWCLPLGLDGWPFSDGQQSPWSLASTIQQQRNVVHLPVSTWVDSIGTEQHIHRRDNFVAGMMFGRPSEPYASGPPFPLISAGTGVNLTHLQVYHDLVRREEFLFLFPLKMHESA